MSQIKTNLESIKSRVTLATLTEAEPEALWESLKMYELVSDFVWSKPLKPRRNRQLHRWVQSSLQGPPHSPFNPFSKVNFLCRQSRSPKEMIKMY